MAKATFDQINLISGDMRASLAFYRKLGVDIPDANVWNTATGAHHANAVPPNEDAAHFDLDSATFAQVWNTVWKGRTDLKGRVYVNFSVPTRADVDTTFRDMTAAGYRGLQAPSDAFWGARYAILEDPDGVAVGVMSPISADKKTPPPDV